MSCVQDEIDHCQLSHSTCVRHDAWKESIEDEWIKPIASLISCHSNVYRRVMIGSISLSQEQTLRERHPLRVKRSGLGNDQGRSAPLFPVKSNTRGAFGEAGKQRDILFCTVLYRHSLVK